MGKVLLLHGRSEIKLGELGDSSVDSIVTDPPYGLSFMGKEWDYDVPGVEIWRECLRVLKPGGHLLSFGGSRTYHRMVVNIEDAGFEIRDQIMWVYGSGFPKSLNIGKAVDKMEGNEREVVGFKDGTFADIKRDKETGQDGLHGGIATERPRVQVLDTKGTSEFEGWGTALKPAHEPIVLARKPISEKSIAENCLRWGTGGLNIDGCRMGETVETWPKSRSYSASDIDGHGSFRPNGNGIVQKTGDTPQGRFPANFILSYPENEYICKGNLTKQQKDRLYKWLNENT